MTFVSEEKAWPMLNTKNRSNCTMNGGSYRKKMVLTLVLCLTLVLLTYLS